MLISSSICSLALISSSFCYSSNSCWALSSSSFFMYLAQCLSCYSLWACSAATLCFSSSFSPPLIPSLRSFFVLFCVSLFTYAYSCRFSLFASVILIVADLVWDSFHLTSPHRTPRALCAPSPLAVSGVVCLSHLCRRCRLKGRDSLIGEVQTLQVLEDPLDLALRSWASKVMVNSPTLALWLEALDYHPYPSRSPMASR